MRDLMEMAYEAYQRTKNKTEQQELFTEMFLEELKHRKSADIAPHLSCIFEPNQHEYKIILRFPVISNKFDSVISIHTPLYGE